MTRHVMSENLRESDIRLSVFLNKKAQLQKMGTPYVFAFNLCKPEKQVFLANFDLV